MIFFRAASLFFTGVLTLTAFALPMPADHQGDLARRYTEETAFLFRRAVPIHPAAAQAAADNYAAANEHLKAHGVALVNNWGVRPDAVEHVQKFLHHTEEAGAIGKLTIHQHDAAKLAEDSSALAQTAKTKARAAANFYKKNPISNIVGVITAVDALFPTHPHASHQPHQPPHHP